MGDASPARQLMTFLDLLLGILAAYLIWCLVAAFVVLIFGLVLDLRK